jgi:hypothetical protein
LGLNFFSLEDSRSCTPKKPSIAEEKKNDTSDNSFYPFKDEVLIDVSPLDVFDVLLGHPYMWKRHAIYESRPRIVIFTLGGHMYRIPKVIPTIVPPKQCRKVVSHTKKFSFLIVYSKHEHKNTTTTSIQAPSIQQKQVNKIGEKCKDSFFTQESHVARLVKNVQPF